MSNPEPEIGHLYHIHNACRTNRPPTEHVGWFRKWDGRKGHSFLRFELIATSSVIRSSASTSKGYSESILDEEGFTLTEITMEDLPQFLHLPKRFPGFDRALRGEP